MMTPTPQEHLSTQQQLLTNPVLDGEKIVISGISGLYPQSRNLSEFSALLYNKVDPITDATLRFNYNHPEMVQYAGNISGLNRFDAQFFKVHFRLANCMDPMARKILEHSYQAIYDAGINPDQLSGHKVGVYIGTCFSEAEKACFYEAATRSGIGIVGCNKSMFANRISYWLNAKGPSMSIDEACCSSTAALEQAYLAMRHGECEAAIVGGAYLCLHPQSFVHHARIVKLCADGKTKSFDENADGCAKSEAINVLFLQKAKNAIRIYSEVCYTKSEYRCTLTEETGPKYGFYRHVSNTIDFIKNFYEEARIPAHAVEYIEAFGCAVPEADKVELQAIEKVFCDKRDDPLFVGSVMSNIGYNEAATGISAITKVLLGYHYGKIAANLHCSNPRQDVTALHDGRMRVVTEHQPFRRTYVAVNGMSVTGINSHVLLHGHYKPKDPNRYKSSIPYLVTISARHESAVNYVLNHLKSEPIDPEQLRLLHNIHQESIAGHLGRGYTILQTNEEQKTVSLSEKAKFFDNARQPLWFVYSGMGSQWAGMGTQLMRIPIFAAAIERCRQVLEPKGINIVDIITSADEKTFDNILNSFVGIAAIQIGLTDVLREVGLVPNGIIGHSVGELGCAYADGCLTAEEMILSAYSRGLVSLQTPFIRGSMAAIGLRYEQISKLCPPEIEVACHNGPESSTISGPADVMREFVAELTAKKIFAKEVPCSNIAYHSRYIADAGPALFKYLSEVIKNPKPRSERWVSTSVPQERWNNSSAKLCSAEYLTNNLLSPVLFAETSPMVPKNAVLVEVAPHGLLQAILKRSLPSTCKNIALTRRKHPDNAFLLLKGIGELFMEGYNPKIHVLYPKVELPVSTGTPFLSHLVEWAHNEKWSMPLYRSANRKTAANCNYVISLQDKEYLYLQGHSMRGYTLYPFAATLVLAWDTFAMTMGVPRKQLSVEFRDLHLYSQPVLHDQRQLRLSISLQRGTGNFEILNDNNKIATGSIYANKFIYNFSESKWKGKINETNEKVSLNIIGEDIYHLLQDRDYSYSGEFCSIESANESMNEARLEWRDNWVTFIDGMLQLNALRQPHTAVSLPTHIANMYINVREHESITHESVISDNRVLVKAEIVKNITRCGGVSIHNIKFENLPPMSDRKVDLKALNFVSNFQSDLDVSSSLEVYLQVVAENINRQHVNVFGIISQPAKGSIFNEIHNAISSVLGVTINYEEIDLETALQKQTNNFLDDVDLVLVQNLSTDNNMCQLLHHLLVKDIFVVSEESPTWGGRLRPSSLYRVLCIHSVSQDGNSQQSQLQLTRWGAATSSLATTTVTVRTCKDIDLLKSVRNNLSIGHLLLVITSYPSPPGLKELINGWRKESNRNKISLVMLANDNLVIDEIPGVDLAFNIFNKGQWGGEYYLPVRDYPPVSNNVKLQSTKTGYYDSLSWVQAPTIIGSGLIVTVHYAGITNNDVNKINGTILSKHNIENGHGMDFSGITDSGERVMGLVRCGAASSVVRAQPQLLWPVPAHWSLEDAATVPLAYAHAFYCLVIKRTLQASMSVFVHGGTGALGQAVLAITLALGCEVFTTVSDERKKHFLRKLFPKLKADHIGCSRDHSFGDMILNATNGNGCDIVISSVKGDLKKTTMNCTGFQGICLDVSQLHSQDEDFIYGMHNLSKQRAYATVDFSTVFDIQNIEDVLKLQRLISEGIRVGYVRPLTRVSYAPQDAARAFRLLAVSRHRGRVLLRMRDNIPHAQPRLTFNADHCHLILCNDNTFGLQFADRLVERGAKKLCIQFTRPSMSYLQMKIRLWQNSGVQVIVLSHDLHDQLDVATLLDNAIRLSPLEGVYMIISSSQQHADLEAFLSTLDLESRKLFPHIRYFAVLNIDDNTVGKTVCLRRVHNQLPATMLSLPELNNESCYRGAVDATERSLCAGYVLQVARTAPEQKTSILQEIIALSDITIPANIYKTTTLQEIGVQSYKLHTISQYLRVQYNIAYDVKQIPSLTIDTLQQLEKTITKPDFQALKGLSTFFTYVDSDELRATTEIVFLPTHINSASMRDDEFDISHTYLCIVPGVEGLHERFRLLCERLKLPALVLQPGLDQLSETVQEVANRFAKVLLKKTVMTKNFYLLGYESGVNIVLEIAAILEDHGLTGTVFCIGYAPDELKIEIEEQLSQFETEEQLQDGVARYMFTLMAKGDTTGLTNGLRGTSTWSQKVDACMRILLGRVPHSAQYTRGLFNAALERIKQARGYKARVRALRSQLVLLRAATARPMAAPLALQQHSQRPVIVHQLCAPLAHAASDLRCTAIINAHLDPEILEEFDTKNLCDTYLLNGNSFMAISCDDN